MILGIFLCFFLAFELSVFFKKNISFTLPMSAMTIILTLYIFSLFDVMSYSIYIIVMSISAVFAVLIWREYQPNYIRLRNVILKFIFTPGLIAFLLFTALIYYLSIDVRVFQWDEFSHWAITVKDMYYSGRLSIYKESITDFKTYPPAMALWEYFFAKCLPKYSDGSVIFAFNFYVLLMMMPVFSKTTWHKILYSPIILISMYLLPYLSYSPWEHSAWRCVYIDCALSFSVAYILSIYFYNSEVRMSKKIDFCDSLALGMALSVLALLKTVGIALAFLCLLIILIDLLVTQKLKINIYKVIFIPVIMCTALYSLWIVKVRIVGAVSAWSGRTFTLFNILQFLSGKEEMWRYDVARKFWNKIVVGKMSYLKGEISYSFIIYPIIWILILLIISALSKKNNTRNSTLILKRYLVLGVIITAEYAIYEFFVLLSEIYALSPAEGKQLACFERYSSDYVLGICGFLLLYMYFVLQTCEAKIEIKIVTMIVTAAFLVLSVNLKQVNKDIFHHRQAIEESYSITNFNVFFEIEEKYDDKLKLKDDVFILANDDGAGYFAIRKMLLPARNTSGMMQSLETNDYIDNFNAYLADNDYSYVFVDKVSDEFKRKWSFLFPNRTMSSMKLYKVKKDGATVSLQLVED